MAANSRVIPLGSLSHDRAKRLFHEMFDGGVPTEEEFCKRYATQWEKYKGKVMCIAYVSGRSHSETHWQLVTKEEYKKLKKQNNTYEFSDFDGKHGHVYVDFSDVDCIVNPRKIAETMGSEEFKDMEETSMFTDMLPDEAYVKSDEEKEEEDDEEDSDDDDDDENDEDYDENEESDDESDGSEEDDEEDDEDD